MSRPRSLLLLLSILTLPLTAELRLGVERPAATNERPRRSAASTGPLVAFEGDQGFVLWADGRPGGARRTVFGSRITLDHELLDPSGILMAEGYGLSWQPIAALSVGDEWVAVWYDGRAIRARTIDRSGQFTSAIVDLAEVSLLSDASAVSNGETILLTFNSGNDPRTFFIGPDLRIEREIPMTGFVTSTVATDWDDYVILGSRSFLFNGAAIGTRVSASGEVIGSAEAAPSPLTWTGEDYAWLPYRQEYVFLRRVNRELTKSTNFIQIAPHGHYSRGSQVVGEGDGTVTVFWFESKTTNGPYDLFAARVDRENRVSEPVHVGRESAILPITRTPTGYLMIGGGLEMISISRDLRTVRRGDRAAFSPAPQYQLEGVKDGAADLITYIQVDEAGKPRVMVGRRGGIARPVHDSAQPQFRPSVASSGTTALITWAESDGNPPSGLGLFAMPLTLDGEALRSEPIRLGHAAIRPRFRSGLYDFDELTFNAPAAIVWTGAYYLIAWSDGIDIFTTRLLENGTLVDAVANMPIARTRQALLQPVLARSGGVVILAWLDGHPGTACVMACGPPSIVRAARLDTHGFPVDPSGFTVSDVPYAVKLDVAVNGATALFSWTVLHGDERGSHFRAIDLNDPDSTLFAFDLGEIYWASVAAHRDGFLATWVDGSLSIFAPSVRVMAMTASRFGLPSDAFEVVPVSRRAEFPVAWTLPGGNAAIGYERTAIDTEMAPRLFFVPVDSDVPVRRRSQGR